jgi:hypothetical protein
MSELDKDGLDPSQRKYHGYDFEIKNGSIMFDEEIKELHTLEVGDLFVLHRTDEGQMVLVTTSTLWRKSITDQWKEMGDKAGWLEDKPVDSSPYSHNRQLIKPLTSDQQ